MTMMVVELLAGLAFGSIALITDRIHTASHAVALGISAFAYVCARGHAIYLRFRFGTGKVDRMGAFTRPFPPESISRSQSWASARWLSITI